MSILFFAQVLGFVGFALGIACFYQKNDKRLKLMMVLMSLNNTVHFALLGAPTASFGAAISMVRAWLAMHTSSVWLALAFIVFTLISGVLMSESFVDLFPILGTCFGTIALFCLQGIKMRVIFLCGTLCWLANNVIVGSIGGTMLELSLLAVNINTIYRLRLTKQFIAEG